MTEKKYKKIAKRLGGKIYKPSCVVDFPETFRITTTEEALDLLKFLLPDSEEVNHFTVNQDIPLKALRRAIKRGLE